MTETTVLIIRHSEKPGVDGGLGIDASGARDDRSLTPRGWQRAGAWAELFAPSSGQPGLLPRPAKIFASMPETHREIAEGADGSKSRRPLETVTPLSGKLGLTVDLTFSKGQEADLAAAVAGMSGVILIAWQHENIAAIVGSFTPVSAGIPAKWPGSRYNVVLRLVRRDGGPWTLDQVVPRMLQGDSTDPL